MPEQILSEKVALVTGASRGIGRAIALAMAREGADLVVTARSAEPLEALAGEVAELGRSCAVVTADMAEEAEVRGIVERALSEYGRVDLLVNNAAVLYPKTNLADFDFADWRMVIEVNLIAAAALSQAVLPAMIAQSSGKIINISSVGGKHPNGGQTPYKASKAALIHLTACLAAEVKQFGIDVNCVCPGGVETEGFRQVFGDKNPGAWEPMPSQAIADVVIFLASDQSAALTGTSIDAFGSSNPIFR
jgi:3-oxoacyl-[acyl-carrier protein] reductase